MKSLVIASALALALAGGAYAADETMPPDAKAGAAPAVTPAPDSKSGATAGSSASGASANSVTAPAIEWPVVQEGPKMNEGKEASKSGSSSSSTGGAEGTSGSGKDASKDMKAKK